MPDPDKTFWWYMYQKTPYEFNTGKGQFFPLSFVLVIFYRKCDSFIVHADDAVIAIKPLASQAEGWYSFHRQWEGRSCLIVLLWLGRLSRSDFVQFEFGGEML